MKIAILANDHPSFVKPMAEGLARMLASVGAEPTVFYDGHSIARGTSLMAVSRKVYKNAGKVFFNQVRGQNHRTEPLGVLSAQKLKSCDVVIIVSHIPNAFLGATFAGIERLRDTLQKPIVLYEPNNLATRGQWIHLIATDYAGRTFGLERYDWYLAASVISEFPLPPEFHAVSLVGMDLDDGSLYPEPERDFQAVVDFARVGFEHERDIQVQALEESDTPYVILDRPMSMSEIRTIYRQACLFFLSCRESFGLPIVELQLCGSYICTPFRNWAPSHYVGKSIFERGEGSLGTNFLVYENDAKRLKDMIGQVRSSYDPNLVIEEFRNTYSHLYHGDLAELRDFLHKVDDGTITHESHHDYRHLNDAVVTGL